MKKLVLSVFLCLLVLCLTLPCFADRLETITCFGGKDEEIDACNYWEYKIAMAGRETHDYFVPYQRIAFLGKLVGFHTSLSCLTYTAGTYCYNLILPDGTELDVYFNGGPGIPYDDFPMMWRVDGYYKIENDMRYLDVTHALEKETYYDRSYKEFLVGFYVQLDFSTS